MLDLFKRWYARLDAWARNQQSKSDERWRHMAKRQKVFVNASNVVLVACFLAYLLIGVGQYQTERLVKDGEKQSRVMYTEYMHNRYDMMMFSRTEHDYLTYHDKDGRLLPSYREGVCRRAAETESKWEAEFVLAKESAGSIILDHHFAAALADASLSQQYLQGCTSSDAYAAASDRLMRATEQDPSGANLLDFLGLHAPSLTESDQEFHVFGMHITGRRWTTLEKVILSEKKFWLSEHAATMCVVHKMSAGLKRADASGACQPWQANS